MNPITTIEEAIHIIAEYQGDANDFQLPIADSLLDPVEPQIPGRRMSISVSDSISGACCMMQAPMSI